MPQSAFSNKDLQFLLQGVNALQQQCTDHKSSLATKLFPADNNLQTLLEYYDKRSAELRDLKLKIVNVST